MQYAFFGDNFHVILSNPYCLEKIFICRLLNSAKMFNLKVIIIIFFIKL